MPGQNLYFISDCHFAFHPDAAETAKRQSLLAFLRSIAADAARLYILGDLFDFWFEWRHVIPRYYFAILQALHELRASGVEIHYCAGNHDFYLGRYLQDEIGLYCHADSLDFTWQNKRFFAAHGDGFAQKDCGYRLLKRVIRSPLSQFLYKTIIHPDLGMAIARGFSYSSRTLRHIDKAAWADEYAAVARSRFAAGVDYVVLGHIHHPDYRSENGHVYVNCGDWISHNSYACFNGTELRLHQFPQ